MSSKVHSVGVVETEGRLERRGDNFVGNFLPDNVQTRLTLLTNLYSIPDKDLRLNTKHFLLANGHVLQSALNWSWGDGGQG